MSAYIPLRARDGTIRAYATVDAADHEWLSRWQWRLTSWGYAGRVERVGGVLRTIYLARELLGLERGDPRQGDHVNGDSLDDRRENLRIASHAENQQNRRGGYGRSLYRGVSWKARKRRWCAAVRLEGKDYHLGYFDAEEDAARVAADFRRANMPYSQEGSRG